MVKIIKESTGCCTELVNKIISSINGEWKTIQEYNGLIVQFESLGMNDVVRVIKDINEEEHKHIGQLTEVIRTIAGDSINDIDDIYKGAAEGIEQLTESVNLKERYGYGVTISDLNNIRDMIEELIEMMDDVGQSELTPEPNTYRIGYPFIGTREGFIDLTNIEEYVSYGEDEEEEVEESLKESADPNDVKSLLLKYSNGYSLGDVYKEFAYKDVYNIEIVAEDEAATEVTERLEKDGFDLVDSYDGEGLSDSYYVYTKVADNGDKILATIFMNETDLGEGQLTLQMSINPEDEELGEYFNESLKEDTVKKSNGKWTNRGDDGTEHGEFNTKKEADAQRRAIFANGYKG